MCLALCGCERQAEIHTPESFEVPNVTVVSTEAPLPETTEETTFISAEETIQPPIAEIPFGITLPAHPNAKTPLSRRITQLPSER